VHPRDVRRLPGNVGCAHVDLAWEAEARADRRNRNAMLPSAGLGDDARLAHATRELNLAEAVVDLVAASVIELIALEVDLRTARFPGCFRYVPEMLRQAFRIVKRARAAAIVNQQVCQLCLKR